MNEPTIPDGLEPVGCDYCQFHELEAVTLLAFTYPGSTLAPFVVENATVYPCPQCDLIRYKRSASAAWELRKALELCRRGYLESPQEFKFIRQVLGLRLFELGDLLGVDKSTISRLENGKVGLFALGKALCLLGLNLVTQNVMSHYRETNDPAVLNILCEIYRSRATAMRQLAVVQALHVGA